MKPNEMDTSLLDQAILFAVECHSGTERRGKGFPYIVHPMEAMAIAATMTSDQEVRFGDRVARLVDTESDRIGEGLDWQARKVESLRRLTVASRDEKIVALGDKLSNMRAIARDYTTRGEPFWNMFRIKDKSVHSWRYHALLGALADLSDTYAYQEFEFLVKRIFEMG